MSVDSPRWELLDATEVPHLLEVDIHAAQDRMALQAMHMVHDEVTAPIFNAVIENIANNPGTAERTIVLPDAFSRVFFETSVQKERFDELADTLQTLHGLGARALFGQDFGSGPSGYLKEKFGSKTGRDHRKIYVADDVSYSFGGCNFTRESFYHNHDFLLRTRHEELADYLFSLVRSEAAQNEPVADEMKAFGSDDTVFVDGGKRNRSTIQEVAKVIAQDAAPGTMRYVSQFRPSDPIEGALYDKEPVISVFNRSQNIQGVMRFQQRLEEVHPPLPRIFYPERYVHAKLITAMLLPNHDREFIPQGGPVILTGSHNYHEWGVRAGTKEIALLSSQEALVEEANTWIATNHGDMQ